MYPFTPFVMKLSDVRSAKFPTPHPLLGLIAGQVCLHASMAGMRMSLPLQALDAGRPHALVGPLIALFAVAPIALALPTGRLADRRGYHVPVRLAVALSCAGGITAVLSTVWLPLQYPLQCMAALLCGAGCNVGLTTIQRSAGRSAHDVTELKQVFSWLGIAPSISNVLGPACAGTLIDHAGIRTALCVLAALPLLTLWVARWVPHERPSSGAADEHAAQPEERKPAWELLAAPKMRWLIAVNWFMSASWDMHGFVVPILGHQRGLRASAIALVLGAFALAVTGVRLVLPVLAHRVGEMQVLRSAMLIVASAFAVYPFATSVPEMVVCAVCLGLALGCCQPMIMTTLHQITPSARHGEAIALRSMAISFSSAVMPLCFGAAGAVVGAGGLFWAMAALVGTGSLAVRELDACEVATPHAREL
jgi:MFS family permease